MPSPSGTHNPTAAHPPGVKRAINLSVNASLLAQAKALGMNLSATLEDALSAALKQKQRENWLRDNHAAMAAYNEQTDQEGVLSDGLRQF